MTLGIGGAPPEAHDFIFEVAAAIADARGEDIRSLPPVADAFDPDALERFVVSSTVPTEISLELYDCRIEIDHEGRVTARPTDAFE